MPTQPHPGPVRASLALVLPLLLAAGCVFGRHRAAESRPYPERADPELQIASALREAAAADSPRRVLLVFGANWCGDSRAMVRRLFGDPNLAPIVGDHYLTVLLDVGERDGPKWNTPVVERYGRPFDGRGIPALVVLDAEGRQLTTRTNNPLRDSDHRHPRKLRRFLEAWSGQEPTAIPMKSEVPVDQGAAYAGRGI